MEHRNSNSVQCFIARIFLLDRFLIKARARMKSLHTDLARDDRGHVGLGPAGLYHGPGSCNKLQLFTQ